jgi:hypothetical protein
VGLATGMRRKFGGCTHRAVAHPQIAKLDALTATRPQAAGLFLTLFIQFPNPHLTFFPEIEYDKSYIRAYRRLYYDGPVTVLVRGDTEINPNCYFLDLARPYVMNNDVRDRCSLKKLRKTNGIV